MKHAEITEYFEQMDIVHEIYDNIQALKKQLTVEMAKAKLLAPKSYIDPETALHYSRCNPIKQGSK